jgi:hypothetical protein
VVALIKLASAAGSGDVSVVAAGADGELLREAPGV